MARSRISLCRSGRRTARTRWRINTRIRYHVIVQIIVSLVQHDDVVVRFEFLSDRIDHVVYGIYCFFYLVRVGLQNNSLFVVLLKRKRGDFIDNKDIDGPWPIPNTRSVVNPKRMPGTTVIYMVTW